MQTSVSPSSVATPTEGYARSRDPRFLAVVRVVLVAVFTLLTVVGILSIPTSFQDMRASLVTQPSSLQDLSSLGISLDIGAAYNLALAFVQTLIFTVVGILIFISRPDDWVALLASCVLVGNGLASEFYAHTGFSIMPLLLILQPIVAFLPIFPLLCLFPNGQFVPKWSRWLMPIYVVALLPTIYGNYQYWVQGPRGDTVGSGLRLLGMLFWGIGTLFLVIRLRRTPAGTQRQQIKQIFLGMSVVIIAGVFPTGISLIPFIGNSALVNAIVTPLVFNMGTAYLAISITAAILRYRLWDIDLVLNRTVIYTSTVIILGLIFIGIVLLLEAGLSALLGAQQTTLAAMIAVGIAAVLFNPTRLRLERVVDRWLFGLRFNLNSLNAGTRSRVNSAYLSPPNLKGTKVGTYEIIDLIGRGGMSEVYLGFQSTLSRQVAIKVLLPHLSANPEFRARFEREARIAANLHHPNIINIFDYGEVSGLCYIAMSYIPGSNLSALLHEGKSLPFAQAIPLIVQIAEALDYAHAQGVIHRDVKPSNIMLYRPSKSLADSRPILVDFGLTKLIDGDSSLTQSGPLGTLAYMAPEQISAAQAVDHRADVYAMGVMCYQILTGKLPFSASNQAALLFAHLHKPAPNPCLIQPDLPPEAGAAVLRALDKAPARRPQSAGVFVEELCGSSWRAKVAN